MTTHHTHIDDRRAKRNVAVLVLAQAVVGAQMPIIFTIAGLAGMSLATNPCWATLPISLTVLANTLIANPMSWFMGRYGRRAGFWLGAAGGTLGAVIGAYALTQSSFGLFLVGAFFTGFYQSAQGFFRFAAADTASDAFRPKAISYVMAGGLASAIVGPQIVKFTAEATIVPFLGSYLAVIVLNLFGAIIFSFVDIPKPEAQAEAGHPAGRSTLELLKTPTIAVAIIIAMVSYALMNLVMTSTPLAVVGCGFETSTAADIVTAHVLAMYVPSFFTGHMIARFGARNISSLGLVIVALAGVVALMGVEIENFFLALILLGIGWNFGFIGATTMLAGAHESYERGRIQGVNDMLVFGGVTLASLGSGGLMNCTGGTAQDGWMAVNLTMVPFLALAGAALIWLVMRPQEEES
ncbi:MFS transporter [Sinisalibacter aestuarii]|uniref:MFS transporter n=1 Tax=Sinisalibacter aestuarii TaxID=2949426 RepID=A0ABQ5LSD0_9RHOB|nr:MFS transporter [Sinisalibacter aestuarii]GKY87899.1 MFS transporter [Sinisalibacter aestuarii]